MEIIQSTQQKGPGKNKRKWTETEDKVLVEALLDMVNVGKFKADNGFRPGFLVHLENVLEEKLPGSGLKGKPHIESRIKTLKKDWTTVQDMLHGPNTSGFGWDDVRRCVTANAEVWDDYVKVHKNASTWRNRSFDHYEDLCNIFGRDRATGKEAQTLADLVEEMDRAEASRLGDDVRDMGGVGGIEDGNSFTPQSQSMSASQYGNSSRSRKKRNRSQDPLVDSIREAAKDLGSCILEAASKFTRVMGVESDVHEMTKKIIDDLRPMTRLTRKENNKIALLLVKKPEHVVLFSTMGEDEKEEFVMDLLHGDI